MQIIKAFGADYAAEVLSDAPNGWWKCDETSGSTLVDSSGKAHNATTTGAWFSASSKLQSGGIDWGGGGASIADHADFKPASITVELWVSLLQSESNGDRGLLQKNTSGSLNDGYGLYRTSGGTLEFFVNSYHNSGAGWVQVAAPANDAWHHLVGTYNGAAVKLYLDGTQVASSAYSTAISHSSQPLRLATYQSGHPFHGATAHAAIYPSALSAARIAAHYAAGTA